MLHFILVHVPSANMEDTGFMAYTATNHQGAIRTPWLHFWGAVIFIYSRTFRLQLLPPSTSSTPHRIPALVGLTTGLATKESLSSNICLVQSSSLHQTDVGTLLSDPAPRCTHIQSSQREAITYLQAVLHPSVRRHLALLPVEVQLYTLPHTLPPQSSDPLLWWQWWGRQLNALRHVPSSASVLQSRQSSFQRLHLILQLRASRNSSTWAWPLGKTRYSH